jgi:hypothetical protein
VRITHEACVSDFRDSGQSKVFSFTKFLCLNPFFTGFWDPPEGA